RSGARQTRARGPRATDRKCRSTCLSRWGNSSQRFRFGATSGLKLSLTGLGLVVKGYALLTINEIFHSIQGESTYAGRPCVFVRLTACDLRCSWCDTPYAFHEGRKMSIDDVLAVVAAHGCPLAEITGGEPRPHRPVYPSMTRL